MNYQTENIEASSSRESVKRAAIQQDINYAETSCSENEIMEGINYSFPVFSSDLDTSSTKISSAEEITPINETSLVIQPPLVNSVIINPVEVDNRIPVDAMDRTKQATSTSNVSNEVDQNFTDSDELKKVVLMYCNKGECKTYSDTETAYKLLEKKFEKFKESTVKLVQKEINAIELEMHLFIELQKENEDKLKYKNDLEKQLEIYKETIESTIKINYKENDSYCAATLEFLNKNVLSIEQKLDICKKGVNCPKTTILRKLESLRELLKNIDYEGDEHAI